MDFGRILNLILRIAGRRAMQIGVTKAIDVAARRGKAPEAMTAEDHRAAAATRASARRLRQTMRLMRRFLR